MHSIPELIDFNAKFNAKHTFCIQVEKALLLEHSSNNQLISHPQLKHAICRYEEWLKLSVKELVLPKLTEDEDGTRKRPLIALILYSDIYQSTYSYLYFDEFRGVRT